MADKAAKFEKGQIVCTKEDELVEVVSVFKVAGQFYYGLAFGFKQDVRCVEESEIVNAELGYRCWSYEEENV